MPQAIHKRTLTPLLLQELKREPTNVPAAHLG